MAPQGRASMASDDTHHDYLESSPDPLNASVNGPKVRTRRTSTRTPLASSSPSKQNQSSGLLSQIEQMDFSSPSKSMVMNTGRAGSASPWRIKVTVQAEPGSGDLSDSENMHSPSLRQKTRTTTTTVPLKDADASSPVKRRGRPRKSEPSKSSKPKRNRTPVRTRRKSSVGVSDASAADLSADAAPKKRRGRPPKKSVDSVVVVEDASVVEDPEPEKGNTAEDENIAVLATGAMPEADILDEIVQPSTGKRQTEIRSNPESHTATPQMVIPIINKISATPQDTPLPKPILQAKSLLPPPEKTKSRKRRPPLRNGEYEETMTFTPPQTELSKRIRARKGTPHSKVVVTKPDSSEEEDSEVDTPSGTDEDASIIVPDQADSIIEVESCSGSDAGVQSYQATTEDEDEDLYNVSQFALDEGATRLPDDTTIIDSEHFSMISVDSLPSSGGLSSPADQQPIVASKFKDVAPSKEHLGIASIHALSSNKQREATRSSPAPAHAAPVPAPSSSSTAGSRDRHVTPLMDTRESSNPPAIEPAYVSPTEAKTPKIGRVVRAGVALQGVLDPERLTPTSKASHQSSDEGSERLGDLFRGFSEKTRKELQAGLRLGEQLARERETNHQSSPALSSPIKSSAPGTSKEASSTGLTQKLRLLTPEDPEGQDDKPEPAPASACNVEYPTLRPYNGSGQLISPARSDDEMSWKVDTPPVTSRRAGAAKADDDFITVDKKADHSDIWHEMASGTTESSAQFAKASVTQFEIEKTPQLQDLLANEGPIKPARGKLPNTWRRKSSNHFNYSDEAEEAEPTSSQMELHQPEPSNEDRETYRLVTPPTDDEPEIPFLTHSDKGKAPLARAYYHDEDQQDEEGDFSEGSDDTGMFFQANLPNMFNKRRSRELRNRKSEKRNLSLLLDEGHSLVPDSSPRPVQRVHISETSPAREASAHLGRIQAKDLEATVSSPGQRNSEGSYVIDDEESILPSSPAPVSNKYSRYLTSSPPVATNKVNYEQQEAEDIEHSMVIDDGQSLTPVRPSQSPVHSRPHPFKNTPPCFRAPQSSPARSSPLRQEFRYSDHEESSDQGIEESSLPLPPSSPFHTIVDATTASLASDQAQFQYEMEGATDSSIRRLRDEANAHAEAYETQYRSLNEIEEVTEPSRTFRSTIVQESSSSSIEDSILRPKREYSPLFVEDDTPVAKPMTKAARKKSKEPVIAVAPRNVQPELAVPITRPTGFLTRLTSSLWTALGTPSPPPIHPAAVDFEHLPKIEPWTRTHYKTLDKLFQLHKKQPTLFAPSLSPSTSNTNNALLEAFLAKEQYPYVGAQYSVWGYSVVMTESLVVIAAVFKQLLTLRHLNEYELEYRKPIDMGDCNPGVEGTEIDAFEIVKRLATVVMGEDLRRDERRGKTIVREGTMEIDFFAPE